MKKPGIGSVLVELLFFVVTGTEMAFLIFGPLSIMVTYREGRVFDAACLVVGWFLVLAHLFHMWSDSRKSG